MSHMSYYIVGGVCLVLGMVLGVWWARQHPKAADTAAQFADSVKAAAEKK